MSHARTLLIAVLLVTALSAGEAVAQARVESIAERVAAARVRPEMPDARFPITDPQATSAGGNGAASPPGAGALTNVAKSPPGSVPVAGVAAGSVLGWMLGLAGGAALGYVIQPDAGDSMVGAAEWWLGAWLGSSVGAATGAWIVNGRNGPVGLASLAALAAAPLVVLITHEGAMLGIPLAQIGVSVAIVR